MPCARSPVPELDAVSASFVSSAVLSSVRHCCIYVYTTASCTKYDVHTIYMSMNSSAAYSALYVRVATSVIPVSGTDDLLWTSLNTC